MSQIMLKAHLLKSDFRWAEKIYTLGVNGEAGRICLQNKSFTLHPIGVQERVLSRGLLIWK